VSNLEMVERLSGSVVNCGLFFMVLFLVFLLMCLHFLLTAAGISGCVSAVC